MSKAVGTTPITDIHAGLLFSVLKCGNCDKKFTVIGDTIVNFNQLFSEHARNAYSFTHYNCEEEA